MNKRELRTKLEELYYQALLNNILNDVGGWHDTQIGEELINRMADLEINIYGNSLGEGQETLTKAPWKKAFKRYLEIKESPLAQAMREEDV